jgi:PIN domain nuclease of toxin-antitoxin system
VPAAVIWECGLLAWSRRIDLRRPLPDFFADLFSNPAYQPMDLTPEQIYRADAARPNRDPFDALICAAARHLELALVTRDRDIRQSGLVRVIW